MAQILEIRNSTAEFLTFLAENKEDGVQVVYHDETIWATQVAMGELQKEATIRNFQIVQLEGTRHVNREPMFEKYRLIQDRLFSSDFDKLFLESPLQDLPNE